MCRKCSSGCNGTPWPAPKGRARWSWTWSPPTGCSFGAAHELESAFTNLLVNGMKYTPAEGAVRMRWWVDKEGAYFSVVDSGIGIPAEHIPRLTERFYRVDAGRSRGQGGSGLGLAIVKHALQRHGGWLEVQSAAGNMVSKIGCFHRNCLRIQTWGTLKNTRVRLHPIAPHVNTVRDICEVKRSPRYARPDAKPAVAGNGR